MCRKPRFPHIILQKNMIVIFNKFLIIIVEKHIDFLRWKQRIGFNIFYLKHVLLGG
jgi:hypothetical protein